MVQTFGFSGSFACVSSSPHPVAPTTEITAAKKIRFARTMAPPPAEGIERPSYWSMQQPVRQYLPAGHGNSGAHGSQPPPLPPVPLFPPVPPSGGSHSGGSIVLPRQYSHGSHGLRQSAT